MLFTCPPSESLLRLKKTSQSMLWQPASTPVDAIATHQLGVACQVGDVLVQRDLLLGSASLDAQGGTASAMHEEPKWWQQRLAASKPSSTPKTFPFTLATARETARMALAPSLALFSVPSRSLIFWSISAWFLGSIP